jgi:hypothetical protein
LRAFLMKTGHYPKDEEVIAIVRRLDADADNKIFYAEFSESIKPQEFSLMQSYIPPISQRSENTIVPLTNFYVT